MSIRSSFKAALAAGLLASSLPAGAALGAKRTDQKRLETTKVAKDDPRSEAVLVTSAADALKPQAKAPVIFSPELAEAYEAYAAGPLSGPKSEMEFARRSGLSPAVRGAFEEASSLGSKADAPRMKPRRFIRMIRSLNAPEQKEVASYLLDRVASSLLDRASALSPNAPERAALEAARAQLASVTPEDLMRQLNAMSKGDAASLGSFFGSAVAADVGSRVGYVTAGGLRAHNAKQALLAAISGGGDKSAAAILSARATRQHLNEMSMAKLR